MNPTSTELDAVKGGFRVLPTEERKPLAASILSPDDAVA